MIQVGVVFLLYFPVSSSVLRTRPLYVGFERALGVGFVSINSAFISVPFSFATFWYIAAPTPPTTPAPNDITHDTTRNTPRNTPPKIAINDSEYRDNGKITLVMIEAVR